jgi:hypothetical protein
MIHPIEVLCSDKAPTRFTQLTGIIPGQHITMRFATGNTTLVHSRDLQLPGGVDFTPAAGTAYVFVALSATSAKMVEFS